jgi:hypothetical protein
MYPDEEKEPKRLTLNFSPIFIDRLRSYAKRHDMKLNAVLKKGFELLENKENVEEAPY